jgi:hypothetical protein
MKIREIGAWVNSLCLEDEEAACECSLIVHCADGDLVMGRWCAMAKSSSFPECVSKFPTEKSRSEREDDLTI